MSIESELRLFFFIAYILLIYLFAVDLFVCPSVRHANEASTWRKLTPRAINRTDVYIINDYCSLYTKRFFVRFFVRFLKSYQNKCFMKNLSVYSICRMKKIVPKNLTKNLIKIVWKISSCVTSICIWAAETRKKSCEFPWLSLLSRFNPGNINRCLFGPSFFNFIRNTVEYFRRK